MKAIAFVNRLARDLDEKSLPDMTADIRQELLDAVNGGLQKLHALAPFHSKTTTASIPVPAPQTISIGVTSGETEITGFVFSGDDLYRSIRISGDSIDNQIISNTGLLHPYGGATGTVAATIYCDAVAIMEPYESLLGDPVILETGDRLTHFAKPLGHLSRPVQRPRYYTVESNSRNRNSPAPSVLRFDSLPDRLYRLQGQFMLSPARITFSDLLSSSVDIPLRAEHVESYLLPVARGILASSRLWRDKETKTRAIADAETAERKYETLASQTTATPNNRVGTPHGF